MTIWGEVLGFRRIQMCRKAVLRVAREGRRNFALRYSHTA
jgi:hypothetical protein